ncbi:MAG: hypothetical protein D3921_02775, partial [Candidatus Electrothrix sp. AW1]|nr:hypothetical protein [Candidatus Electrothrix gigas]
FLLTPKETKESLSHDPAGNFPSFCRYKIKTAVVNQDHLGLFRPDGKVVAIKWIDGSKEEITLNAPKGMAIAGNNLFVADINQIQVFSLPDGRQKASIALEGSTFLNGMASGGPDNSVYVTDSGLSKDMKPSGTDAVYQVWANGKYEAILQDKEMGHPNGIWHDKDKLIVNTWGSGELFSINSAGQRTNMPKPPAGGLDGLVRLNDGRLIVSSWKGSALYALKKNGLFTVLAKRLVSPADIGVDSKRNRLLLPFFKEDKVFILQY